MKLNPEARYAESHEWSRQDGDEIVVGISDHAQESLSDVVYVELPDVGDVFEKGDVDAAKEYYKYYRVVTEQTDALIVHIMDSKDLSVRDAVVYALFSRYLKRISAHLANILTTVINPFHEVGYGYDEYKDEEIQ